MRKFNLQINSGCFIKKKSSLNKKVAIGMILIKRGSFYPLECVIIFAYFYVGTYIVIYLVPLMHRSVGTLQNDYIISKSFTFITGSNMLT